MVQPARRYLRTGRQAGSATDRLASKSKRKMTDGKRKTAGNVRYPVHSSLMYGRHGDLAPRPRYNTYVTDMREIPTDISFVPYTLRCETLYVQRVSLLFAL